MRLVISGSIHYKVQLDVGNDVTEDEVDQILEEVQADLTIISASGRSTSFEEVGHDIDVEEIAE